MTPPDASQRSWTRNVQKLDLAEIVDRELLWHRVYDSQMQAVLDPVSFLITSIAGWINQHQQLRFNDDQRRGLAAKAKQLSRKLLAQVATIVTPETLLAWHRRLIAKKYDGSAHRSPGRPRIAEESARLIDGIGRRE